MEERNTLQFGDNEENMHLQMQDLGTINLLERPTVVK
jgi:hypothetical protein